MKRWDASQMLDTGKKMFVKIHRRKYYAHHNSEIHYMAREIGEWLPKGIQSLQDGTYSPRCLKRYYFSDEVVDQLHLSDRILQHVLLKQLKPTFKHVMNPNVYHLAGPTGVKYATQRIKQVLEEDKPNYFLRVDIKSFYASIPHFKLIHDIQKYYDDPKLIAMLEAIITNPIDAPCGYKNPINGIALRGPLSQFFSGIYLKPLDDAFLNASVHYFRFQDDVLILCKTKRQMNRCRRRMMAILQERHLSLSRKKSRMGSIHNGFHFLGIDYLPTQLEDHTNVSTDTPANDDAIAPEITALKMNRGGGIQNIDRHALASLRIIPHARTLRKAREQVKAMVADEVSPQKIRSYLHLWTRWWAKTIDSWNYQDLLKWFIEVCWNKTASQYAAALLQLQSIRLANHFNTRCIDFSSFGLGVGSDVGCISAAS